MGGVIVEGSLLHLRLALRGERPSLLLGYQVKMVAIARNLPVNKSPHRVRYEREAGGYPEQSPTKKKRRILLMDAKPGPQRRRRLRLHGKESLPLRAALRGEVLEG